MLSVFTPTHNPRFLSEAHLSLQGGLFDEWVIVCNNGVNPRDLPQAVLEDPKVVIIDAPGDIGTNVGALKRYAVERCRGDILVEFDHDDLMVPTIFGKIREAFEDPEVVLAHSNWCEVNNSTWTPRIYSADYGWRCRTYRHWGHNLLEMKAPRQCAHTASSMYYGPNHVRAFRRAAYDAVGGYNPDLPIADDLDLVCRLWMVGRFRHIDECGYVYRVHGNNTYLARNADIQIAAGAMREQYFRAMAESECKRDGELMLDVGGRFNCPPGYKSVDLQGPADYPYVNLDGVWPFEDNSVGIVRASDFLEHLPNKMNTLSEIYRILRPGGYLLSDTPSTTGPGGEAGQGADQDPTHMSRWNRNAFWYVTKREVAKYIDNTTVRFLPVALRNWFPSDYCRENFIPYVRADLVAIKGDRPSHGYFEI